MIKYISKRVILLLLTLAVTVTIVFFLLELMDGYPTAIEEKLAQAKTPEAKKLIIDSYNQEGDAWARYATYVRGIFSGNFGTYYQEPNVNISTVFIRPLRFTFLITGPAFLIGTLFGFIFGFIAGYKRGKWPDIVVNIIAVFFVSVPSFVLATFLILFAQNVGIPYNFRDAQQIGQAALALILPILIISITSFSTLTYYIRNEVVEVLSSDYITIARAKGNSETRIFFKHILRNISIPLAAIVFPSFIYIVVGSLIIEIFFNVPGSSSVFATAITRKEKYIVLFSVLFFSALAMLVRLFVDLLFVVLDPRIKLAEKSGFQPVRVIRAYFTRKSNRKAGSMIKGSKVKVRGGR